MNSARTSFHFGIVLVAGAAATAMVALSIVIGSLEFGLPPLATLLEACRQFIPHHLAVDDVLILALTLLDGIILYRVARSLTGQLRANSRLLKGLPLLGRRTITGSKVEIVDASKPLAFCCGYLRPRIYISSGALKALSGDELQAVIAHEAHHQGRYDPLRMLILRVLADGLLFMPLVKRLSDRFQTLAELKADKEAVKQTDARSLASALLSFTAGPGLETAAGIEPERVDQLSNRAAHWRAPRSLIVAAVSALALFLGLTVAAYMSLHEPVPNLILLLAQSCMLLMAAIPLLFLAQKLVARRSQPS